MPRDFFLLLPNSLRHVAITCLFLFNPHLFGVMKTPCHLFDREFLGLLKLFYISNCLKTIYRSMLYNSRRWFTIQGDSTLMKIRRINRSTISLASAVISWIFAICFSFSYRIATLGLAFCCEVIACFFGYYFLAKTGGSDNEKMRAIMGVILGSTSFLILMTSLTAFTWQLGIMLGSIYTNWW